MSILAKFYLSKQIAITPSCEDPFEYLNRVFCCEPPTFLKVEHALSFFFDQLSTFFTRFSDRIPSNISSECLISCCALQVFPPVDLEADLFWLPINQFFVDHILYNLGQEHLYLLTRYSDSTTSDMDRLLRPSFISKIETEFRELKTASPDRESVLCFQEYWQLSVYFRGSDLASRVSEYKEQIYLNSQHTVELKAENSGSTLPIFKGTGILVVVSAHGSKDVSKGTELESAIWYKLKRSIVQADVTLSEEKMQEVKRLFLEQSTQWQPVNRRGSHVTYQIDSRVFPLAFKRDELAMFKQVLEQMCLNLGCGLNEHRSDLVTLGAERVPVAYSALVLRGLEIGMYPPKPAQNRVLAVMLFPKAGSVFELQFLETNFGANFDLVVMPQGVNKDVLVDALIHDLAMWGKRLSGNTKKEKMAVFIAAKELLRMALLFGANVSVCENQVRIKQFRLDFNTDHLKRVEWARLVINTPGLFEVESVGCAQQIVEAFNRRRCLDQLVGLEVDYDEQDTTLMVVFPVPDDKIEPLHLICNEHLSLFNPTTIQQLAFQRAVTQLGVRIVLEGQYLKILDMDAEFLSSNRPDKLRKLLNRADFREFKRQLHSDVHCVLYPVVNPSEVVVSDQPSITPVSHSKNTPTITPRRVVSLPAAAASSSSDGGDSRLSKYINARFMSEIFEKQLQDNQRRVFETIMAPDAQGRTQLAATMLRSTDADIQQFVQACNAMGLLGKQCLHFMIQVTLPYQDCLTEFATMKHAFFVAARTCPEMMAEHGQLNMSCAMVLIFWKLPEWVLEMMDISIEYACVPPLGAQDYTFLDYLNQVLETVDYPKHDVIRQIIHRLEPT